MAAGGPYPLNTLAAVIDSTGIWAPAYIDILNSLVASYQSIFGSDVYLDPDSQDGQWLAIIARAIFDTNQAMVATYNAFSPATAIGAGLSSVVKINGIERKVPSQSTVPVDLVGTTGTEILNGVVSDLAGANRWDLPASVVIPYSGLITVTATCETAGAIQAGIGTISVIVTPVPGWQTVYNRFTAAPGAPVEDDFTLRRRQAVSTALPAQAILGAILANVEAQPGVQRAMIYENDSNDTDIDTLPPHSIAVVAEGGATGDIAGAIAHTKPPGSYTYGTVAVGIIDSAGIENTIRYFPLTLVTLTIEIHIAPLDGWLSAYAAQIRAQVADFVSTLPIGYDSYLSKLYAAAELPEPEGLTYDVTEIRQTAAKLWFSFDVLGAGFDHGFWHALPAGGDVPIAFNEAAFATTTDVSIVYATAPPG